MFRCILLMTVVLAVGNSVAGESCGSCGDESGSACWTTKAKRDANCGSKGWLDQNYCSRVQEGCGQQKCHCCGSQINSGCQPHGKYTPTEPFTDAGYKCFPTAADRDKNCAGYPKRCQAWRLMSSGRQGRQSYWHNEITYCCGQFGYPDIC